MSASLLPRFAARLLLPVVALGALALLGDPLPADAQDHHAPLFAEAAAKPSDALATALREEAEAIRIEAEAARAAAHRTAAQMRWFMTLPAAGAKRCGSGRCAAQY
jgi:hypothetical protein